MRALKSAAAGDRGPGCLSSALSANVAVTDQNVGLQSCRLGAYGSGPARVYSLVGPRGWPVSRTRVNGVMGGTGGMGVTGHAMGSTCYTLVKVTRGYPRIFTGAPGLLMFARGLA